MAERRNRPRIAGQRRSSGATPTLDETPAVEEVEQVDEKTPETAPEDVTPATPKPPVPAPEAPVVTQRERRQSDVLLAALGLVVVLTLVVAGILGVKAWHGKQAEDARSQAATAGRKAAETALSYDYRDLDKSFAAARATMTPDFAQKFDATAKVAGELATKTKATVKADVREVGVRDGDADRVTLIIFVNQTTTSTITKGSPRVDLNRTRFTMVRNGDRWLVQEIAGL
jgi:Mce-associated membrane protein